MKKYVSTILLLIASAQAKEPLSPTVSYLDNAVKPCLTDHGKSIALLSWGKQYFNRPGLLEMFLKEKTNK